MKDTGQASYRRILQKSSSALTSRDLLLEVLGGRTARPGTELLSCTSSPGMLRSSSSSSILQKCGIENALHVLNWLSLACRRKLHKCILVFNLLQNILLSFLQGIGLFMNMQLEEVTTCTHQSRDTIRRKENF